MTYTYDFYGWYCGNGDTERSTNIAPSNLSTSQNVGDLRSNWTGHVWVEIPYIPPPSPDMSVIKAQMWEEIKQERDRRTQYGGYKVGSKWFHSDVFSRAQQMGLVMLGSNIPSELQWKTMDGSFVTMTPTLANQIFMAAAQSDANLFAHAEQLRLQMESDPSNFNIAECSWPLMYGE